MPGVGSRVSAESVGFDGAVYSLTNRFDGNTVALFGRNEDGTLTPTGEFATGGNGGIFDGGGGGSTR